MSSTTAPQEPVRVAPTAPKEPTHPSPVEVLTPPHPGDQFDPKDPPLPLEFFQTRYQLSRTTLWRYRRAGLHAIGVGAKTFIRESDLVRVLTQMAHHRGPVAAPALKDADHE
ncbi:MAG: helix-turn-helix domain-containing protein [Limisphaerales bacterium]